MELQINDTAPLKTGQLAKRRNSSGFNDYFLKLATGEVVSLTRAGLSPAPVGVINEDAEVELLPPGTRITLLST